MAGGACVAGGACMAGGHAWQGGMCGGKGGLGVHGRGACVVGGHVWQGGVHGGACVAWGMCGGVACMARGMHGRGGMHGRYYEIRSMSGRYASYWNAFLLDHKIYNSKQQTSFLLLVTRDPLANKKNYTHPLCK